MKKLFNYSLLIFLFSLVSISCSKTELDDLSTTMSENAKAKAKTKMDTPMISCGVDLNGSTEVSINIVVTAGETGAPAGFSIQWLPKPVDYDPNTFVWPASDDPSLCKGSFSGNANLSRYNLSAGQSVVVNIGEFLFDNGASTNCSGALECGTEYIFRAFAHASSTLQRSDFTSNLVCSTLPCDGGNGEDGCTYTQGYWKTHGPDGCDPSGNNDNVWPADAFDESGYMYLGGNGYTDIQLCQILNTPASGNGLIALAHQLIAAKLNIANGAGGAVIAESIALADDLITGKTGNKLIPPIGNASIRPAETSALTTALARYNEGATGPGHCD